MGHHGQHPICGACEGLEEQIAELDDELHAAYDEGYRAGRRNAQHESQRYIQQLRQQRNDLLAVAEMVDAWGHGLRHPTDHEAKMVKAARAAIAKARA